MQITLQIPDVFFLSQTPKEISDQIKLYTALMMYQSEQISAGAACEMAGIDRFTFLKACKKYRVPVIQYDAEEIVQELEAFE